MKTKNTLMTAAAMLASIGLYAAQMYIPTVEIGDAYNDADTRSYAEGGTPGAGKVDYVYNIGTTGVTAAQYATFLNAVATDKGAASHILNLYSASMNTSSYGCGITRVDNGDSYSYTVTAGKENMPVNFITVYDAMRFCNWLTTSDTEIGVYMLNNTATGLALITRNEEAWLAGGVAIASLDEWYKAAFYQGDGTYSTFANGQDSITNAEANFYGSGFDNLSSVFTFQDVNTNHYGVLDMNGNVYEWTDSVTGSYVYLRGGYFNVDAEWLAASVADYVTPSAQYGIVGFRVSSLQPIPEPSTYAAIFGALALTVAIYRRRK